jgi:serine/threonine protein kinase
MVELIIGTVGRPSPTDVEACHIASFVDLDKVKVKGKRSLQSRFADAGPDALDLLTKLLAFNPQKRITAAAALAHPYVLLPPRFSRIAASQTLLARPVCSTFIRQLTDHHDRCHLTVFVQVFQAVPREGYRDCLVVLGASGRGRHQAALDQRLSYPPLQ